MQEDGLAAKSMTHGRIEKGRTDTTTRKTTTTGEATEAPPQIINAPSSLRRNSLVLMPLEYPTSDPWVPTTR